MPIESVVARMREDLQFRLGAAGAGREYLPASRLAVLETRLGRTASTPEQLPPFARPVVVSVLDPPNVPVAPVWPRIRFAWSGFAAGLIAALALALKENTMNARTAGHRGLPRSA